MESHIQTTLPKPFIFVLMPFDKDFRDTYELGIKPACADAGGYAERLDEQIFQESMLQRIYNQIAKADVIVADMTGRNANVFYETGYAHALGKHVILLTRNSQDIPFDLTHYPHIIYEGSIKDLIPQLTRRVKWAIDNLGQRPESLYPDLQFFCQGKSLLNNPTLDYPISTTNSLGYRFKIDIYNSSESRIKVQEFRIALLSSDKYGRSQRINGDLNNIVNLPTGGLMHLHNDTLSMLPGEWQSYFIQLTSTKGASLPNNIDSFTLRVFTYSGTIDIPFSFRTVRTS